MWLALLWSCAPGVLLTRDGREPLRSAWYGAAPSSTGLATLYVLASNSDLLCELPETEDPGALDEALVRQSAGLYREGARVLMATLSSTAEGWSGAYEIVDTGDPGEAVQRQAALTWWEVVEAEVESEEGVIISYTPGDAPGDYLFVPRVPAPGSFSVTVDEAGVGEATLSAEFDVGSLDLAGRFDAAPCDPDSSLFASLGASF